MPHHLDLELWRITLPWDLLPFAGKGNWSRLGGRPDVSSRKGWLSPESVTALELCAPRTLQRSYPCSDWVTGRCSSHFTVDEVKRLFRGRVLWFVKCTTFTVFCRVELRIKMRRMWHFGAVKIRWSSLLTVWVCSLPWCHISMHCFFLDTTVSFWSNRF